jgi:hypothetical protein
MSRFEIPEPPEKLRLEELGIALQEAEELVSESAHSFRRVSEEYRGSKAEGELLLVAESRVVNIDGVEFLAKQAAVVDGTPRFTRESIYVHVGGRICEKARIITFPDGTLQVISSSERDENGRPLTVVSKAKGPGETAFKKRQEIVSAYDETGRRVRRVKEAYGLPGEKFISEVWERLSGGGVRHTISHRVSNGTLKPKERTASEQEAALLLDAPDQFGHAQPIPDLARRHLHPFTFS